MSLNLTEKEIKQRMIEWRNLKRLHSKDQQIKADLKDENRQLRAELAEYKAESEAIHEAQNVRIAELERMVFGKKKDKSKTPPDNITGSGTTQNKPPRTKDSYHRPIPPAESVTDEQFVPVAECGHCHGPLTDIAEYVRYVEDVVLAALNQVRGKTVTRLTIQRGWCTKCGNYTSGQDLRGSEVTVGANVRMLVVYLTTIMDLTYSQVRTILLDLYDFHLAEGEIAPILQAAGRSLTPEYQALLGRIRSGPGVHLDESPFHIQADDNKGYGWVMAAAGSTDVAFKLADSRGKGNAEELLGPDYTGIRISDGYGGYRNLPGGHQQCWVHFYRVIRDLSQVSTLPKGKRALVHIWYAQFAELYTTLCQYWAEPFNLDIRTEQAGELLTRVHELCRPDRRDPGKLASLKAHILDYDHALFTCLLVEGIPTNNNPAEQRVRKIVLKRKKSFGCKTNRGAKALEVLLSVCWSTWYREGRNFFPAMQALTQA